MRSTMLAFALAAVLLSGCTPAVLTPMTPKTFPATTSPMLPQSSPSPIPPTITIKLKISATPDATQTPFINIITSWERPADGMVMVKIPEGEFTMGSINGGEDEPPHMVKLNTYWIDQTEVTNARFALFVKDTGYQTEEKGSGKAFIFNGTVWNQASGADWEHPQGSSSHLEGLTLHPVVYISWNDAAAYCEWAGARLPTEAEWEKAARGTDARVYPWGNQAPSGSLLNSADVNFHMAWTNQNIDDGYEFTAPVGSYPAGASPYGALDMSGNVYEWVADWYSEAYYSQSPYANPTGPASGEYHVLRGGSFGTLTHLFNTSVRIGTGPHAWHRDIGFRCARSD